MTRIPHTCDNNHPIFRPNKLQFPVTQQMFIMRRGTFNLLFGYLYTSSSSAHHHQLYPCGKKGLDIESLPHIWGKGEVPTGRYKWKLGLRKGNPNSRLRKRAAAKGVWSNANWSTRMTTRRPHRSFRIHRIPYHPIHYHTEWSPAPSEPSEINGSESVEINHGRRTGRGSV